MYILKFSFDSLQKTKVYLIVSLLVAGLLSNCFEILFWAVQELDLIGIRTYGLQVANKAVP